MTALRVIFFRLYESPRYLVAAGRPTEAIESLQLISRFNGEELDLSLRDVRDYFGTIKSSRGSLSFSPISPVRGRSEETTAFLPTTSSSILFDADNERSNEATKVSGGSPDSADYNTTGETNTIRNNRYSFTTPTIEIPNLPIVNTPSHSPCRLHGHLRHHSGHSIAEEDEGGEREAPLRSPQLHSSNVLKRRRSSVSYKSMGWLPRFIRKPLLAYMDRIALVLAPEWIWKTLTIWAMWFLMSLGASPWWLLAVSTQAKAICRVHDIQRLPTEIIREAVRRDNPWTVSTKCEVHRPNTVPRVLVGG